LSTRDLMRFQPDQVRKRRRVTNGKDRLDRIENDLETVKDILIAVARRAESTDERLERLAQRMSELIA